MRTLQEKESRERKGFREVLKKRRRMNGPFYLAGLRGDRWASSNAMPDAAGGHEAAKPEDVF